jgi:hypothetical protein
MPSRDALNKKLNNLNNSCEALVNINTISPLLQFICSVSRKPINS